MLERYRHSILPAHYLQEALGQASQHVIETSPFFTPSVCATLYASRLARVSHEGAENQCGRVGLGAAVNFAGPTM